MKFKNIFKHKHKHKKVIITEQNHPEKEWYDEAQYQTIETLPKFINHLMNDYIHDYGTICKAIGAAAAATAFACNKTDAGGLSGFQASFIPWTFMRAWGTLNDEVGAELRIFDDMLYPQYEYRFEKTIDSDTFEMLQKIAKQKIEADDKLSENDIMHMAPEVKAHMQSIINGIVPFGYSIKN